MLQYNLRSYHEFDREQGGNNGGLKVGDSTFPLSFLSSLFPLPSLLISFPPSRSTILSKPSMIGDQTSQNGVAGPSQVTAQHVASSGATSGLVINL